MWINYTKEHGTQLNLPEAYAEALESSEGSHTIVYVEGGTVYSMAMLIFITDDVVELTLQMYAEPPNKIRFARQSKAFVASLPTQLNASRLQANAAAHIPSHQRFIELLGLTREGVMKGFGGTGVNHIMYGVAL